MSAHDWLEAVAARVEARLPDISISWTDNVTVGISRGLRGVVLHSDCDNVFVAPSISTGLTIGSRLESRVQHLEVLKHPIHEDGIEVAVESLTAHLRG